MRADLLLLAQEDLELFSNRGTVRRAQAECAAGEPALISFTEVDGHVVFDWQDATRCTFPSGKSLTEATCTCSAVGVCRHIVRSVLTYQSSQTKSGSDENWWPGEITELALEAVFKPTLLKRARDLIAQGQLVRLSCGRRPVARFISLSHTVRFIVPHNIQYAVCDCRDQQPCMHVAMAALCFRLITANTPPVTVETGDRSRFEKVAWITKLEDALTLLTSGGFNTATSGEALRQLQQLALEAAKTGSFFITELIDEMIEARERQMRGDAQFAPEKLATIFAELLCRLDAANAAPNERSIPINLILGGKWNAPSLVKTANLTALGSIATSTRQTTELRAYAVENNSGEIVSTIKKIANQPGDEQPSFQQLSRRPTANAIPFATLAASNIIVKSGKMTASRELKLSGSQISASPQDNNWSLLSPSIYFDDVEELHLSLTTEFPSYLAQRSASLAFRVLKIETIEKTSFWYETQVVDVLLTDKAGGRCRMLLPYRSRAAEGFELTLKLLQDSDYKLIYVAGLWSFTDMVTVRPASLVFEVGGERIMLQPDNGFARGISEEKLALPTAASTPGAQSEFSDGAHFQDTHDLPINECLRTLGNLMVKGVLRAGPIDLRQLAMLEKQSEAGQSRLLSPAIAEYIDACARMEAHPENLDLAREAVLYGFKRLLVVAFLLERERH